MITKQSADRLSEGEKNLNTNILNRMYDSLFAQSASDRVKFIDLFLSDSQKFCMDILFEADLFSTSQESEIRSILLKVLSNEFNLHKLNKIFTSTHAMEMVSQFFNKNQGKFIEICFKNPKIIPYLFSNSNMLKAIEFEVFLPMSNMLSFSAANTLLHVKDFTSTLEAFLNQSIATGKNYNQMCIGAHPLFIEKYNSEFTQLVEVFEKNLTIDGIANSKNPAFIKISMGFDTLKSQFAALKNSSQASYKPADYSTAEYSYAAELFSGERGDTIASNTFSFLKSIASDSDFIAQLKKTSSGFLSALVTHDQEHYIENRINDFLVSNYTSQPKAKKLISEVVSSKNTALLSLILNNQVFNKLMQDYPGALLSQIISLDMLSEAVKVEFIKVVLHSFERVLLSSASLRNNIGNNFSQDDFDSLLETISNDIEEATDKALMKSYTTIVLDMIKSIDKDYYNTNLRQSIKESYLCELDNPMFEDLKLKFDPTSSHSVHNPEAAECRMTYSCEPMSKAFNVQIVMSGLNGVDFSTSSQGRQLPMIEEPVAMQEVCTYIPNPNFQSWMKVAAPVTSALIFGGLGYLVGGVYFAVALGGHMGALTDGADDRLDALPARTPTENGTPSEKRFSAQQEATEALHITRLVTAQKEIRELKRDARTQEAALKITEGKLGAVQAELKQARYGNDSAANKQWILTAAATLCGGVVGYHSTEFMLKNVFGVTKKILSCDKPISIKACHVEHLLAENVLSAVDGNLVAVDLAGLLATVNEPCEIAA